MIHEMFGERQKTGYNQVSQNKLEEISAMAAQERWRSDLGPGTKGEVGQEMHHEGLCQKGNSTQHLVGKHFCTGESEAPGMHCLLWWNRKVDAALSNLVTVDLLKA